MIEAIVVLTTTETPAQAEKIAHALLAAELAACVQILPPLLSMYRWQGKLAKATENLLLIKTTRAAFPAVETTIKANHPYETPEIIAVPVLAGAAEYLTWLDSGVRVVNK